MIRRFRSNAHGAITQSTNGNTRNATRHNAQRDIKKGRQTTYKSTRGSANNQLCNYVRTNPFGSKKANANTTAGERQMGTPFELQKPGTQVTAATMRFRQAMVNTVWTSVRHNNKEVHERYVVTSIHQEFTRVLPIKQHPMV